MGKRHNPQRRPVETPKTFDPADSLERREFWETMERCLGKLPGRMKAAFALREMDGLPSEEVQDALGATAGNLWTMLYRARLSLCRCLDINWFKVIPAPPRLASGGSGRQGQTMKLSCRDTTRLASESLDHRLTLWQRMQVAMYLMMCGPCRRARRLMQILRDALGRLNSEEFEQLAMEQSLAPEVRERIQDALRKKTPPDENDGET